MINPLRPVIACVLALVFSNSIHAAAAPFELPTAFKAEAEMQMMGQKLTATIICGSDNKQRVEIASMGMVNIVRKDTKKVYVLMTAQKQIMEMPFDPAMAQGSIGFAHDQDSTWENLGQETVREIACDKWKVTSAKGETMTCWVKPSDHTPVRISGKDESVVDFISFTAGKQDEALFEPPTGWTTVAMPGMGER